MKRAWHASLGFSAIAVTLVLCFGCARAFALDAEVKACGGSPMIHVDGKPISPLTFFGWESGIGGADRG